MSFGVPCAAFASWGIGPGVRSSGLEVSGLVWDMEWSQTEKGINAAASRNEEHPPTNGLAHNSAEVSQHISHHHTYSSYGLWQGARRLAFEVPTTRLYFPRRFLKKSAPPPALSLGL